MKQAVASEYLLSPEKRALDLAVAGSVGMLALLGGATMGAAIFAANRINPIFRQERRGKGGLPFDVVKLTSLAPDGSLLKLGKFVRDYGLDETTQFINVLRGNMATVGYRPFLQSDLNHNLKRLRAHFPKSSPLHPDRWMELRDQTRPGITGPTQTLPETADAGSLNHLITVITAECVYLKTASLKDDLHFIAITPHSLLAGHSPSVQRDPEDAQIR